MVVAICGGRAHWPIECQRSNTCYSSSTTSTLMSEPITTRNAQRPCERLARLVRSGISENFSFSFCFHFLFIFFSVQIFFFGSNGAFRAIKLIAMLHHASADTACASLCMGMHCRAVEREALRTSSLFRLSSFPLWFSQN